GVCPLRCSFMASCLWQASHVCTTEAVRSWNLSDFGLWTLWQLTHDTLRASCMLPCQSACGPLPWQDRHVLLASRALIAVRRLMSSFLPESTCFCPGPWQVSQLCPLRAAGVRSLCALPCSVAFSDLPSDS